MTAADIRDEQLRLRVLREITRAAAACGVRQEAVDQVATLLVARYGFEFRGGRLVAVDKPTGLVVGTLAEVVAQFVQSEGAHFLAPRPTEETRSGSRPEVPEDTPNPWKPETFNLTEQGRILRRDPELARRLAAEAGVRLRA